MTEKMGGIGFSGGGYWHGEYALANRRRAGAGSHAPVVQFDAGGLVAAEDLAKGDAEVTLEVAHAVVVGAELFLERYPRSAAGPKP